jgi:predicted nucleic acid-binding protein
VALPSRLFCDTSFFYACFDPNDANHERAEELNEEAAALAVSFFTTWDIVGETVTLLRYRKGFRPALTFLEEVMGYGVRHNNHYTLLIPVLYCRVLVPYSDQRTITARKYF